MPVFQGVKVSAETVKLLRKTPIFSTLDSSGLKSIADLFKEKTYSADEVLFREGTLGDTLYIIKEGAVKITRSAKEGEDEASWCLRREGDIFGESGFIDESPHRVTAQATESTQVLELSRSNFLAILNSNPLIAYQIVKVMSWRLRQSDLRLVEDLKEKNEQLVRKCGELEMQLENSEPHVREDESAVSGSDGQESSELLLSWLPYPVILVDQDNQVSFFNKAAENQFGYEAAEIVGKSVSALWDESSWTASSAEIEEEIENDGMWEGEILARKNDGERFACWLTITEIVDQEGASQGKLYVSPTLSRLRASACELDREPVDLKDLFEEELLRLKTDEKFRDITFVTSFEENVPRVNVNKRQLRQLLCALLDNAASALHPVMDRQKTITVEVSAVSDRRDVQIMISDNGVGIGPANLPKVFKEPLATRSEGSGLGLLFAGRIVREHGGSIEVHSHEGAYTLFVIKLPALEVKPDSAAQPEPALESGN